jgi:hypothetical protein
MGFAGRGEGAAALASRRSSVAELRGAVAGYACRMRVMFATYLVVIVAGLTFFTIVGLSHH